MDPKKRIRAALYARVSTSDQSAENQLLDLRRYARERGWSVMGEYVDQGISGTASSRPALDRMMESARKRKVDVVLCWRFDRFARSVKHLVLGLDELRALGIQFVSYNENIDTGSPLGAAIFTIIAAMGALERDIIVERVKAGLNRARSQGKKIGRPPVSIDPAMVRRLVRQGCSLRAMATKLGVSRGTIARAVRGVANKPPPSR